MFGRKIEIRAVKDDKGYIKADTTTKIEIVNVDFNNVEVAVKKTVTYVGAAVMIHRVVKTGCKIAEIYASK